MEYGNVKSILYSFREIFEFSALQTLACLVLKNANNGITTGRSHYSLFWLKDLSIFPSFDSFEGIVNERMRKKEKTHVTHKTKYIYIFFQKWFCRWKIQPFVVGASKIPDQSGKKYSFLLFYLLPNGERGSAPCSGFTGLSVSQVVGGSGPIYQSNHTNLRYDSVCWNLFFPPRNE